MGLVKGLRRGIHVVVAEHIEDRHTSDAHGAGRRDRNRPRTILASQPSSSRREFDAAVVIRHALFIAHRPHEDTRPVPVPSDQITQAGSIPPDSKTSCASHQKPACPARHMRPAALVSADCAKFVEHCSPFPAACERDSTAPHPALPHRPQHGPGDCRCPSVSWLTIQEKTLLCVEVGRSNSKARLVSIDGRSICLDLGHQSVEMPFLKRPEHGLLHHHLLCVLVLLCRRDGDRIRTRFAHHLPFRIKDRSDRPHSLGMLVAIRYFGPNRKCGRPAIYLRRDECSPLLHVHRATSSPAKHAGKCRPPHKTIHHSTWHPPEPAARFGRQDWQTRSHRS